MVITHFKHQSKISMRSHIESEINRTSATDGRIDKVSREIELLRCIPVAWNLIQQTSQVAEVYDNLAYDREFYTCLSV